MKKEKTSFWADFKAFITRGNVLDMAVGVVVGGAFGAITSGLVNYIINPVIAVLTGGVSLDQLRTPLGDPLIDEVTGEQVVDALTGKIQYQSYIEWGLFIQTIINFLIIALSVFVVVRYIRKAEKALNRKKEEEAAAAAAKQKEIDDAKAAADAAAAQVAAEAKAAEDAAFKANLEEQTKLLREISAKLSK